MTPCPGRIRAPDATLSESCRSDHSRCGQAPRAPRNAPDRQEATRVTRREARRLPNSDALWLAQLLGASRRCESGSSIGSPEFGSLMPDELSDLTSRRWTPPPSQVTLRPRVPTTSPELYQLQASGVIILQEPIGATAWPVESVSSGSAGGLEVEWSSKDLVAASMSRG